MCVRSQYEEALPIYRCAWGIKYIALVGHHQMRRHDTPGYLGRCERTDYSHILHGPNHHHRHPAANKQHISSSRTVPANPLSSRGEAARVYLSDRMDQATLEKAVATLGSLVKDNAKELELVFTDAPLTCDGPRRGVSHKLIPALSEYAKSLPQSDSALIAALVCNGDNYTAWARRKEMLLAGETSNAYEIHLLNLILSKQPKIGSAWEHRKFVAKRILEGCKTSEGLAAFVRSEIAVCERTTTLHRRNYYAWAHRAWLAPCMNVPLIEEERNRTKDWIEKNVSDASAFHHLELLNGLLCDRKTDLILNLGHRLDLAVSELVWCATLCTTYVGHEAIWTYRRACVGRLLDLCPELNRTGWRGIKDALKCVDFICPLTERQRLKSYNWWRVRCKDDPPNLDALLQLIFDEMNVAACLHVGDHRLDEYALSSREARLDMKLSGAYSAWLGDRILQFLENNVPEAILSIPVKHLEPGCLRRTTIETFVELFTDWDELSSEEFLACFKQLPEAAILADDTILELFKAFDVDNSDSVSQREFLAGAVVLCGSEGSKTKIAKSFAILDTNGNGTLDRAELKQYCVAVFRVMALTNDLLKNIEVVEAIADASVDDAFRRSHDGTSLTLEEFTGWLESTGKSEQGSRPSAVTTRLNVLEVANLVLRAQ